MVSKSEPAVVIVTGRPLTTKTHHAVRLKPRWSKPTQTRFSSLSNEYDVLSTVASRSPEPSQVQLPNWSLLVWAGAVAGAAAARARVTATTDPSRRSRRQTSMCDAPRWVRISLAGPACGGYAWRDSLLSDHRKKSGATGRFLPTDRRTLRALRGARAAGRGRHGHRVPRALAGRRAGRSEGHPARARPRRRLPRAFRARGADRGDGAPPARRRARRRRRAGRRSVPRLELRRRRHPRAPSAPPRAAAARRDRHARA